MIAEAPVALECVLFSRMDIPSREIYFGRVQRLRTRPGLVDRARMRVRLTDYAPVARFGASFYTTTRERFTLTGDPTTDIDSL